MNIPQNTPQSENVVTRRDFLRQASVASSALAFSQAVPQILKGEEDQNNESAENNLQKQWKEGEPAFRVPEEHEEYKPDANFEDDVVTLKNRGRIVSRESYPNGSTIEFTWTWKNDKDDEEADRLYPDHLAVVLRTSGKPQKEPAFEIQDGIALRFMPNDRCIYPDLFRGYEEGKRKGPERFRDENGKKMHSKELEMQEDTPYKVKVVDRDDSIQVFFGDNPEPVLELTRKHGLPDRPEEPENNLVAIYDREPVAGVIKESKLEGLRIKHHAV